MWKQDNSPQPCVYNQTLNDALVDDGYSWTLIPGMLNRLHDAWIFIIRDLWNVFYRIWNWEANYYQNMIGIEYVQFE